MPKTMKKRTIHQMLVFHMTNIIRLTMQVVITMTDTTAIPSKINTSCDNSEMIASHGDFLFKNGLP